MAETTVTANETYALAWAFFSQSLNITTSGTNVTIAWPVYPAGFLVQATADLSPPTIWTTNNLPAPVIANGSNYIFLNATNPRPVFPVELAEPFSGNISEREMFSDAVAAGDGRRDEIFPDFHRVRQIVAERQRRANRGGISAAGAVRANASHKRRGQKQFRLAVKKNVHRLAGIFQMTAFHQHRAAEARLDFPRRGAHFFQRRNRFVPVRISASSRFGVTSVASGSSFSFRIFTAAGSSNLAPLVETITGSTTSFEMLSHFGFEFRKNFATTRNIFRREQHSGFHRRRLQFFKHGFDLLPQHFRRTRLDAENAPGILRGEAGDGAGAVDAQRGERFQIGLDARAAAAVRAGDGQRDGQFFPFQSCAQLNRELQDASRDN